MEVKQVIFRAYDIRGLVESQLTPTIVLKIGKALGSLLLELGEKNVVCGRDGRLSSPILMENLQKGILSTGCNIIDIGVMPSPLVYFAASVLDTCSGIVVTGSHNPPEYNGVKMMIQGNALSAEQIQALYHRVLKENFQIGQGTVSFDDICSQYIDIITQQIKLKRKLKVVIDCANGTAGVIAPELYKKMGCDVITLYPEVDGHFPNHHPDPSAPENLYDLIHAVKKHNADIGLAFDGDSDRLGVITNLGENIWPDRQLILYALDILKDTPGASIVYDVKCSSHVNDMVKQHGGKPIMWKTGHSLVKAKLRETGALLAGEMSGHVFFKDKWFGFDDAIYCGARLLAILAEDGRSSSEIFAEIPDSVNTPELKLPVDEAVKFDLMQRLVNKAHFPDAKISTIDGLRVDFDNGWGLVRPSNTTPYLILRFEADNETVLNKIKKQFAEFLLAEDSSLQLPFEWE